MKLEFQYFDPKNAMQKTNVEKNHRAIQLRHEINPKSLQDTS